ncbi:MAG: pilus assembly PilX N-terminal domain-containing protein [Verrucomicrobiae bacterium]|nr:pilus assembly PilX N-terminal domain-containing protein [Verrucomicrobiae bacterium]
MLAEEAGCLQPLVHQPQQKGVALVITLSILAMLTVLLVAFVSNIRIERMSSAAYTEQLKARLAAQAAVEQAIHDIGRRTKFPDYITFFSNHGVVFVNSKGTWGGVPDYFGDERWVTNFYQGATDGGELSKRMEWIKLRREYADLNDSGLIFPRDVVKRVEAPWVCYSNSLAAEYGHSGRGLIRYTYWIDDESSKLNINAAGHAANPGFSRSNVFDVTAIDLRGLTGDASLAGMIVTNRQAGYHTVASLLEVGGISWVPLYENRLRILGTTGSGDCERRMNGGPRLNLSQYHSQGGVEGAGAASNLAWAMQNSLPDECTRKWGSVYQMAANICDQMSDNQIPTDSEGSTPFPYSTNGFLGVKNVPYFDRFSLDTLIHAKQAGAVFRVGVTNRVIWQTFNFWRTRYDFKTNVLMCAVVPAVHVVGLTNMTINAATGMVYLYSGTVWPLTCDVTTNSMKTVGNGLSFEIPTNVCAVPLTVYGDASKELKLLFGVSNGTRLARLDVAHVPQRPFWSNSWNLTIGMKPLNTNVSHHVCVGGYGDPRVNNSPSDWMVCSTEKFGYPNERYLGFSEVPINDCDSLDQMEKDGGAPFCGKPFPSPGFLGYVSYPPSLKNSWRTLKMYGDGYSKKGPDWLVLDLFTANNSYALVQGKINVNSDRDMLVDPRQEGSLFGLLSGIQVQPGARGCLTNSALIGQLAAEMVNHAPYWQIGEIGGKVTALSSLSQGGLLQNTDERRESIIRGISGITTVRGRDFTIWALGQSLSASHGRTNVLGEAMAKAVIEIQGTQGKAISISKGSGTTRKSPDQNVKVKYYRLVHE